VAVVALCLTGAWSVSLPWAVVDLLGTPVPFPGSWSWAGLVSAVAFAVLAAGWLGHAARPRLPRAVPLGWAVAVGVLVPAVVLGPSLLAGGLPAPLPGAVGAGKWLASAAGAAVAAVAGLVWWLGRSSAGPRQGEPAAAADRPRE
jgi:hypothetical protein